MANEDRLPSTLNELLLSLKKSEKRCPIMKPHKVQDRSKLWIYISSISEAHYWNGTEEVFSLCAFKS